jgi:ATP-binding cassette, subfamily B, multidrug efflux pump
MKNKDNTKQTTNQKSSRIDLYKKSTYRKRNEKPKEAFPTTIRLIKYLKEERKVILFVIFILLFQTIFTLASSYVYRDIIDNYIREKVFSGLVTIILMLGAIYLGEAILTFISHYIMIAVSQRTLKKMRKHIFVKLQKLAISFFDRHQDGDIMSRITNDVDNISSTLTQTVTQFIGSILMLTGTIILMFIMNIELTLVTLTTVPLIYFAAKGVAKFSRRKFRQMRYEIGALNGFVAEQIDGAKVIQSFVQEEQIIQEFTVESDRVKDTTIKAVTFASLMGPIMEFLGNLRYVIIITAGAILVIYDCTTIGTISSFVILARQFGRPLNQLANLYTDIQNALSGAERIFDILDDQTIIENKENAIELTDVKGRVELSHVSFAYVENEYVLKDVSIKAEPGQKIALVGHTGAGKTTIINLITRFYDINEGEIRIDGTNIKNFTKESLLEHVGIVLQDTNLFTTTIMENVRYGKLEASDEEVMEACKLANCHDFIMALPNQYQTLLSRNGSNLSHGQRQLLSIARTILKNPDILILDEATSSVDTMTEIKITHAINNLTAGRTSFIIAHRLSTIRNSDVIVVLKDGQIIEKGSHQRLLDQKGVYYQLNNAKPNDDVLEDYELSL